MTELEKIISSSGQYEKAMQDAKLHGVGWLKVDSNGAVEHATPAVVASWADHLNAIRDFNAKREGE